MAKKYTAKPENSAAWRVAWPLIAIIAFFLSVCFTSKASSKGLALLCVAVALVVGFANRARLRERFYLPMLALALMTAMGGISTFYAVSGKFALYEFLKLLISLCLAVILLALARGDEITAGRRIAFVLEWAAALAGLFSIDTLSTRWFSQPLLSFLQAFTDTDYLGLIPVEANVRMNSIFENPNAFAASMGIGVLLSLGLAVSAEHPRERKTHQVCLFINALAFVLAFSMGAIAFIAVAFLVYLAIELKTRRAALFVLMVETLVITLLAVVPIAMTSLDEWDGFQIIPLLCTAVGAAVLVLLDRYVGQAVVKKLEGHGKILAVIIAVVLAAAVAFVVLGYNLTGGIGMEAGASLRRSVYPESGDYILSVQGEGQVNVKVETQNKQDTMMHTSTVIYDGALSDAAFTVPEDSMVVYLTFSALEEAWLESVALEGVQSLKVPLGYKLLPGFVANRVQGLFANQNAIQRTVFFEDGMKIFARHPVFGSGMGSFENGIKSVQDFHYETKYAHNHYIQVLAETGVVGLVLFLGLLAVSAVVIALERRKKEAAHPMTAALGAVLVFMAGHAAVEVDFSYFCYLPFAFGVFAMISLCCGGALPVRWLTVRVKNYALIACAVLTLVFTGFLAGNMMAKNITDQQSTFETLRSAVRMDVFERNDYMLSYVVYSEQGADDFEVQALAEEYAARLAQVDSNTIPLYLANFYFSRNNIAQGMAMLEKFVDYVSSDAEAWEQAFKIAEGYAQYFSGDPAYIDGLNRLVQMLDKWNEENLGSIVLSDDTLEFLSVMGIK